VQRQRFPQGTRSFTDCYCCR